MGVIVHLGVVVLIGMFFIYSFSSFIEGVINQEPKNSKWYSAIIFGFLLIVIMGVYVHSIVVFIIGILFIYSFSSYIEGLIKKEAKNSKWYSAVIFGLLLMVTMTAFYIPL